MATRERPPRRSDDAEENDALASFDPLREDVTDEDVEVYLAEQAAEEETKKPGFWNLQTGSGLALVAIGTAYMLQQLGFFPLGYALDTLVTMLPWLAGVLIILTGFGVLSWSPARRRRKAREAQLRRQAEALRARQRAAGRQMGRASAAPSQEQKESARPTSGRSARAPMAPWVRMGQSWSSSTSRPRSRKLAKARGERKIAGVAAGIARYLGVDPLLIRIAFVVGAIFGNGFTIPLYLVLAFAMPPAEPEEEPEKDDAFIRITKD